ncbi:MAG: MHS family MFS transporter [Propionibacteriaceae bacterium]|nr:MHS family MFS transporter [Propionibacteriaceae bacterium]
MTETTNQPGGMSDKEYADNLRRATLASSIGSALEYYDFALYGLAAALIFGQLFFPALGANAGLIASFATLAVGFLARPIGGLFFGVLGDKIGRKWVLMVTIALMGGASTLIGALPTADQLGNAGWVAPVLLVVLRLAQGLGAGAEQAGATVLMAEYSPRKRRGFFSALPFVGIMLGTLLASLVFWAITLAPDEVLFGWLWRIPFLISFLLIIVAVYIRSRLRETPAYIELEKSEQVADHPMRELFTHSRRNVLLGIGLRMAENGGSYIYSNLAISFMVLMGVDRSYGPIAVASASIIGLFTIPISGALSDRFGRRLVYRAGALFLLIWALPSWYLMSLGNPILGIVCVALAIGFGVNGMLGPQCAHLPELFGARHRYIGVAVSREFSAILAGGLGPFLGAWLLQISNNAWWPVGIYVLVLCLITFACTFLTPETVHRDVTSIEDAHEGEDLFANMASQR